MGQRDRKKGQADVSALEQALRVELRGILRQYDELKTPIEWFLPHPHRKEGEPRYFVAFDRTPPREVSGLRCGLKKLTFPDERFLDSVLRFAQSTWHLKDHLGRLAKGCLMSFDPGPIISKSEALRICADLANTKKHGTCEDRSGLTPQLGILDTEANQGAGLAEFDLSKNGLIELFYDGANKRPILLVSEAVPVSYRTEVLVNGCRQSKGDAVELIMSAFHQWRGVIREWRVLDGDNRESIQLRKRLFDEL